MLPKAKRLNSANIAELRLKGKRANSALFSVLYRNGLKNRFSVNISKKVYKKAVDRNTAKRKTLAILRDISPIVIGDYSINIRGKINKMNHLEIKNDLIKILCQK